MADEGEVSFATVARVLDAVLSVSNVSISIDNKNKVITLVKDNVPEVIILPDQVTRRMLQRLQWKYGVKIEYFFHPEMCCKGNGTRQ